MARRGETTPAGATRRRLAGKSGNGPPFWRKLLLRQWPGLVIKCAPDAHQNALNPISPPVPRPDHDCARQFPVVRRPHADRRSEHASERIESHHAVVARIGDVAGPLRDERAGAGNRHGHFEPVTLNYFNIQLQHRVLGVESDMPDTEAKLAEFLASEGKWDPAATEPAPSLEFGRNVVRRLVESGEVSGFKDPRIVLLWPYWNRVLGGFPGLRVVLLTLLRSPHEVAMSIFSRGKGRYGYQDALDVTAVNLRRLQEIRRHWAGQQALVRFDPRVVKEDLRNAADACHLPWHEDVFQRVYDPSDWHHSPARIDHDAQRLFDDLSGLPPCLDAANALTLARDCALRERVIQRQFAMSSTQSQMRADSLERQVCELASALVAMENHVQDLRLRRQAARALAHMAPTPVRDWLQENRLVQVFYGKIRG